MKVFFDIWTNDEVLSDSFKLEKTFNDVCGEVKSKYRMKGGETFDIGKGNEFGGGDEDEAVQDQAEKVLDIVDNFNLKQTSFGKSDFNTYFKEYMKKVKAHLEANNKDRVAGFMDGAKQAFKWVNEKFDEFTFYYGDSESMDGGVIMSYWKDEADESPTFVYFLDGYKQKTF